MKQKICAFILGFISISVVGQDNQYTQFFANKVYLNPAFAGTEVCPRLILGFRDQWPGMPGEYVSYTASYDASYQNIGYGLLINGDDAGEGTIKTNNLSGIISPKIPLDGIWTISFALEAGVVSKRLSHEDLIFSNQVTATGINNEPQEIQSDIADVDVDLSSGVLLYSRDLYMGYSMHHIMEPNISFLKDDSPLYKRHTVHFGGNIHLPQTIKEKRLGTGPRLSPQVIYQQQGPAREVNLGLYYVKNRFTTGLWYRNQDAIAVLIGVQTRKFSFGFSYDITTSKLMDNSGGAFELSTAYKFNCRTRKKSPQRLDCPSF